MPPDKIEPGSAQDWMRYARSDLALAQQSPPEGVLLETLCFHIQQSVEKALKAILVHHNIRPPRTHDIQSILLLIEELLPLPDWMAEAALVTDYAIGARYPIFEPGISLGEYQQVLKIAQKVVDWASSRIADP